MQIIRTSRQVFILTLPYHRIYISFYQNTYCLRFYFHILYALLVYQSSLTVTNRDV
jgi:hypothetical protein